MSTTNYQKHSTKNPIARFFLNRFTNTLLRTIRPLTIHSVLDVGCGEGFMLDQLQKECTGEHLEGIDAVDEALIIGKKLHPQLVLKKGDIYKLLYKDDSFDLVICIEVLEHLEDPKKALKELVRVSKKYILLSVPNEPWFTISRILRGKNLLQLGKHPEHIQYWTSGEFEAFVSQESLKIVSKKHPIPWTMVLVEKR